MDDDFQTSPTDPRAFWILLLIFFLAVANIYYNFPDKFNELCGIVGSMVSISICE